MVQGGTFAMSVRFCGLSGRSTAGVPEGGTAGRHQRLPDHVLTVQQSGLIPIQLAFGVFF